MLSSLVGESVWSARSSDDVDDVCLLGTGRQGARVPVHRMRPQRPFQLRGDATAGPQLGRAAAGAAARRLLAVHLAAPRPADPARHREHPRCRLPPPRHQARESTNHLHQRSHFVIVKNDECHKSFYGFRGFVYSSVIGLVKDAYRILNEILKTVGMLKMEDIAQYNGTEGINGPKKDSAIPDGVNQLPRTI